MGALTGAFTARVGAAAGRRALVDDAPVLVGRKYVVVLVGLVVVGGTAMVVGGVGRVVTVVVGAGGTDTRECGAVGCVAPESAS